MEYELWECRNLARTVLGRVFGQVTQKYEDEVIAPLRHPILRLKRKKTPSKDVPRIAHYRRFDRFKNRRSSMIREDSSSSEDWPAVKRATPAFRESPRFPRIITTPLSIRLVTPNSGRLGASGIALTPRYKRFHRDAKDYDPFNVEWPPASKFTPQMGKRLIMEFIAKKWCFGNRISYKVDYLCVVYLRGLARYKYCSRWMGSSGSSSIYFTIDASTFDRSQPVSMTFAFPDMKRSHRPSTSHRHFDDFLSKLDPRGASQLGQRNLTRDNSLLTNRMTFKLSTNVNNGL